MFKDKLESMKALIVKKTEGNQKKNIENLVVFLIILVITIIGINVIWGGKNEENKADEKEPYKELAIENSTTSDILQNSEYNLESKLENILAKINGVRKSKCTNNIC